MLNVQLTYNDKTDGHSVHDDTDFSENTSFAEQREFVLSSLNELLRNGEGKLEITLKKTRQEKVASIGVSELWIRLRQIRFEAELNGTGDRTKLEQLLIWAELEKRGQL